jgi:prepilin-type N-terminal cleavage/methylation domain-containing protein
MSKSFTLIEILVVIVVIGIISSFIIIGLSSVSDKANIAKSQAFSNSLKNSLLMNLVSEYKITGTVDSLATVSDVLDSWGSNNASVINGNPYIKGGNNCLSDKCIAFDGTGDTVTVPDSLTLDSIFGTENFTLEAWIYSTKLTNFQGIINKRTSTAYAESIGGIFVDNNGDTLRFLIGTVSSMDSIAYSIANHHDKWLHVVGTAGGGYINFYINSLQTGSPTLITADMPQNDDPMTIGGFYAGSRSFSGRIDEVRIYNNPIPATKIRDNYFLGLNKLFKNNGISLTEYNKRISELKFDLTINE